MRRQPGSIRNVIPISQLSRKPVPRLDQVLLSRVLTHPRYRHSRILGEFVILYKKKSMHIFFYLEIYKYMITQCKYSDFY